MTNENKPSNKIKKPHARRRQHALYAGVASVFLLVITASVVALGQRWQSNIDLSASQRHSLAEQSIAAVVAQSEPVELIAVMGPDTNQRDAVSALVSRYQKHNEALSLEFVNLETQPSRVRELQAAPGGESVSYTHLTLPTKA